MSILDKKTYIGTKIIKAYPTEVLKGEPGYTVEYPDGYLSWSPKETFENSYREISEEEIKLIKE